MSTIDITEKQARFFTLSLDMLCIADFDGHFRQINAAWEPVTGFSRDELMAKPFIEFVHPDDHAATIKETNQLTNGAHLSVNFENRYVCKDGSIKWLQWNATSFPDEKLIYAVARDITKTKQAEFTSQQRTEFEKLTISLSTQFINLPPNEIDDGINRALETISYLTGVDRSYIFIFSADGTEMDNAYEWCKQGVASEINNLQSLQMADFPWFNQVIKTQEVVHIPRVTNMPATAATEQALLQSQNILSLINLPMIYQGSLVGFLSFDCVRTEKNWEKEEIRLLKIVAEMFVNALQRKQVEQREALAYEFGRQLTTLRDPDTLLVEIVNRLQETFGYYHAHVYLCNKNYSNFPLTQPGAENLLVMREGTGEAGLEMKRHGHAIPLNAEQSLVARSARSLEPVIVNDVRQNPKHLPNPLLPDTRSEAAIPLALGQRLIGVLDVQHTTVDHFSVEEIRTLQIVASQLSVALSNAQLFDENAHRLAIIENASNLIALMSLENQTIIYINPAGAEMAGYTGVEQVVGQSLAQFYQPDDFARIENQALDAALGKGIWRGETFLKRTDDKLVPVDQTIFVICDDHGQPQTLATIVTDITEQKQAEDALQKINEDLESRVTERTETLVTRTRDLERSNSELEQFAYVASHDLQEPLRMITSYVQLLSRRYQNQLDDEANEFIDFAVDGATRMQRLINDLLAYSRVGTNGKPFEPTNCTNIIKQVMHNMEPVIIENKATITYDQLPVVMADNLQLEQLFQNLISNAIKFRNQISPQIHISATQNQVNEWMFSIQDNGIGIEQEYAERIFVIFQRLHTRDKYSGTGIGLAICKKIIERHNGQIWFESQPGAGATFYFTIPCNER